MKYIALLVLILSAPSLSWSDDLFLVPGENKSDEIYKWLNSQAKLGKIEIKKYGIEPDTFRLTYYSHHYYPNDKRRTYINVILECPLDIEDSEVLKIIRLNIVVSEKGELQHVWEEIGAPFDEQKANKCVK